MSFELTGTLVKKYEIQEISSKFRKRDFVLEKKETNSGFDFTDYIKFQLTQDKCSILDPFEEGDVLKVDFNLRGRKWEKNGEITYFTNLEAWKIEKVSSTGDNNDSVRSDESFPGLDDAPFPEEKDSQESSNSQQEFDDDLPF